MKASLLHSARPDVTFVVAGDAAVALPSSSVAVTGCNSNCSDSAGTVATAVAGGAAAAPPPPRPACRALGPRPPRDAAAAPCAGASRHHPMQALPGDEEGGAAPRRHPPTRPDGEGRGRGWRPTGPEPLSSDAAPLATRQRHAPQQGLALALKRLE